MRGVHTHNNITCDIITHTFSRIHLVEAKARARTEWRRSPVPNMSTKYMLKCFPQVDSPVLAVRLPDSEGDGGCLACHEYSHVLYAALVWS